jgi:hypothetical protein
VLCNKYSLSPADLLNQLDAFLVTQDVQDLTLETFGRFEQEVKNASSSKVLYSPYSPCEVTMQSCIIFVALCDVCCVASITPESAMCGPPLTRKR